MDTAWDVVTEQFLANPEWRKSFLKNGGIAPGKEGEEPTKFGPEMIRPHMIFGMNFPPSQFQLHLQSILPPLTPKHHRMYQQGIHFTKGRFVPIEYIVAALKLDRPIKGARDLPLERLFEIFAGHGIDYDAIHTERYKQYGKSHEALANWKPSDFTTLVSGTVDALTGEDATAMEKADAQAMSSYGAPYEGGKPTRQYYKFADQVPTPLPTFL